MGYTEEQIKGARRALSGQDEEPVTLRTDPAGGSTGDAVTGEGGAVSGEAVHQGVVTVEEVLGQVKQINPALFEVAVAYARIAQLEQELARHGGCKGETDEE